ncbi:hypothetical protein ADEAN_000916600 [Angomonas deanei]|uniref:Uncharacterized protein n=1 Tax=Angomonas deanei TaxID=59799 RepID=A0A7G2CRM5_9TRYP|nr:hypothetical protein ADEAN_000916600 [Angomonas deanei]
MRKSFLVESQPHPDRRSVDQRKASSAKRQPSKEHARALHFHHSPDSRRTSLSSPAKQTSHHAREEKERRRSTQEGSSERKPSKTTNENPPIEKRSDAAPTSAVSAKKEEYVAKPNNADNINQHLKDISSWLQDQ